jgi:hypothetical protein
MFIIYHEENSNPAGYIRSGKINTLFAVVFSRHALIAFPSSVAAKS